ncbi:MAG: helix-turn-helix domain-containing protein, partial [Candidatus Ozemobacteraceae bacterium]
MKTKVPEKKGFPARLGLVVGKASLREFSKLMGISYSALYQYLMGKSEPSRTVLLTIAQKTGVSLEWLIAGQGGLSGEISGNASGEVPTGEHLSCRETPEGYISPPVLEMAAPGASGKVERGQLSEAIVFEESWLKKEFGVNPRFLCMLEVRGEAM